MGISANDFTIEIDSLKGHSIQSLKPGEDSLSYSYTLTPGTYQLTFKGEGYNTLKENISFTYDYPRKSYDLNATLKPKDQISKDELISLPNILFDFDKSIIDSAACKKLDSTVAVLKDHPDVSIEVIGHTDAVGNENYNMKLSEKRAGSIVKYLTAKGIDSARIKLKAKGEHCPVALNTYQDGKDCPKGRKFNRRVEIKPFSNQTKSVISNLQKVPNELKKKKGFYYTVLLFRKDKKLPKDYFDRFHSLGDYSIEMFQNNGEYIYTMGKFESQAQAIGDYQQVVNLKFNQARIISCYQLKEMLNMDVAHR